MPETPERARSGATRQDPWLLIGLAAVALVARIVLVATAPHTAPVAARGGMRAAVVAPAQDLVHWVAAEDAEAASLATGKPILYEFGAEWCGPCRAMQREIFSEPNLAKSVESYVVPVRITDRQREEGMNSPIVDSLQRVCKVDAFPTLALVSRGKVIDQQVGYPGAAITIGWLARAADHTHKPQPPGSGTPRTH